MRSWSKPKKTRPSILLQHNKIYSSCKVLQEEFMPIITFLTDNITVESPSGTKLQDIVATSGATLPFSCRMGSCGTCRCVVVDGFENVNPLTEAEQDLFDCLTSVGKHERLGCQLVVTGDVKIRAWLSCNTHNTSVCWRLIRAVNSWSFFATFGQNLPFCGSKSTHLGINCLVVWTLFHTSHIL